MSAPLWWRRATVLDALGQAKAARIKATIARQIGRPRAAAEHVGKARGWLAYAKGVNHAH